jgi:twitching motility protein PilT
MTAALVSIDDLLRQVKDLEASDLHLTPGSAPVVRIRGSLERLEGEKLTPDSVRDLVYRILSTEQQKTLEVRRHVDMAYSLPGVARFRVNVFFQRATLGAAFRMIPTEIKTLDELGLP